MQADLTYDDSMIPWLSLRAKQRVFAILEAFDLEVVPARAGYFVRRRDPFGRHPWADVGTILGAHPKGILDLGAHIGQTAVALRSAFPRADIYSFEPDPENFRALVDNTQNDQSIFPIQAAVGREAGRANLYRQVGSQTHSLLPVADRAMDYVMSPGILAPQGQTSVDVRALDEFCDERNVHQTIELVKADVQGYEIEVLSGALRLLGRQRPPLLFLEVSFVPQYQGQPLFADLLAWLASRKFHLVGLYDIGYPTHYCAVGANALFVHASMARRAQRI